MLEDIGLLFFTVVMLSLLLTPLSITLSHRLGAVDHPVGRSVHSHPMPRLGGLGMAASMLMGITMFLQLNAVVIGFIAGLAVISLVGLIDDIVQLRPVYKLLGQILACILFISISGLTLSSLGDLLGLGAWQLSGLFSYALTLFAMAGIINAFNLSDGLDGLAAGLAVIVSLFLGFLALYVQEWVGLSIIVAVIAGVIGFLKFNSYPARLFMGDVGSLMLGFSMAAITLILVNSEAKAVLPISIAMILAMPLADTLWVMSRRMVQGKSPVSPDKTHLHHRLLALGVPHGGVVIILYAWVASFGVLALTVKALPEYGQFFFATLLTIFLYAILVFFERRRDPVKIKNVECLADEISLPIDTSAMAHFLGLSMKLFPYVIVLGLSLPLFMSGVIDESLNKLTIGLAIFVLAAYPWKAPQERQGIVYGLFYLCGFTVLYAWNSSNFDAFDVDRYLLIFSGILLVWSLLKAKFKSHREVFFTSSFELILIFISWFIPFVILPSISVPQDVLHAAKLSCLEAIPLLIAMKITIKPQPHRNKKLLISLIFLLCLIALRST